MHAWVRGAGGVWAVGRSGRPPPSAHPCPAHQMLSRVSIWGALMTLVERARIRLGVGRERPGSARAPLLGALAGQDLERRGVEGEGRLALVRKASSHVET